MGEVAFSHRQDLAARPRGRQPRYNLTPEIEARLRAIYRDQTGSGEVRDLAKKLGLPRWRVSRWALQLGLVESRTKEPNWSDEELAILERHAHLSMEHIQKHLKRAGYHRSLNGITLKRKRLNLPQNLGGYSATNLAMCFGVDIKAVTRWIQLGYLRATRRGTNRLECQGGDAYWIVEKDIRQFIVENVSVIDIRKVDKFWFVDMLNSRPLRKEERSDWMEHVRTATIKIDVETNKQSIIETLRIEEDESLEAFITRAIAFLIHIPEQIG